MTNALHRRKRLAARLEALNVQITITADEIERANDCGNFFGSLTLRKELRRAQERADKIAAQLAATST